MDPSVKYAVLIDVEAGVRLFLFGLKNMGLLLRERNHDYSAL